MVVSSETPRISFTKPASDHESLSGVTLTLEVLRVLLVHKVRQISAIIKDHVQRLATRESIKGLLNAPRVLLLGLSLPGVHRDTSSSNSADRVSSTNNKDSASLLETYAAAAWS